MNFELINYLLDRFRNELANNWIVNLKDYTRVYPEDITIQYGYLYLCFTNGQFSFSYDLANAHEIYKKGYVTEEVIYSSIKSKFENEWVRTLWKDK